MMRFSRDSILVRAPRTSVRGAQIGLFVSCMFLVLGLVATTALADDAGVVLPGMPVISVDLDASAPEKINGCVETFATGAGKPTITDTIDPRGRSGYASVLVVKVEHGKGETVLPGGIDLQTTSDAAKELAAAGWVLPAQDGSGGARVTTGPLDAAHPERSLTVIELPLVALPKEGGRHVLTLPALPIAIARAGGEVANGCTHEHRVTIDDPIAETNDPEPKANPPPRQQREEWTALKRGVIIGGLGSVCGALAVLLLRRWSRRPRPAPPPPPPRPPWEVALEQLDEVRHAGLLETKRYSEYFDRVNDALRRYLGARYDFDGLESTTDEMIAQLKKSALVGVALEEVSSLLRDCDLVKFANLEPSPEDCAKVIDESERIVRSTTPPRVPPRRDG